MSQHFRLTRITRRSTFRALAGIGVVASVAAIAGCKLDTSTGPTGAQGLIQFINAAPRYNSVNLNVDSAKAALGQVYGSGSYIYVKALANPRQFTVRDSSNTTTIASGQLLVADQTVYTVILTQHAVGGGLLILQDTVSAPPANQVGLRIVNASPSAGPVDLYVTGSDSTLNSPNSGNVVFENGSDYVNVLIGGVVRVRITIAGTKTVLLDIDASTLMAGQVRTIVLIDAPGGGLPATWLVVG